MFIQTVITIALLAICFIIYFVFKNKNNQLLQLHQQLQQQLLQATSTINTSKEENQQLMLQVNSFKTQVEFLKKASEEQQQNYNQVGEVFKAQFQNLAQEILENKSKSFNETSQHQIKVILDPLKNELKEFKEKVDNAYKVEARERHYLEKHINHLIETSNKVGNQADSLANALKTNVKQQGNWGEMLLESILDHSGLVKNREYFVQEFIKDAAGNMIKDENGNGLQPDVTIVYPDQRKVIIDSKVSLVAWDNYVNDLDTNNQKQFLEAHIKSVKNHVDGLSKKNYPKYAKALDYVIMFVPIEPAFLEALKQDTGLWKYAYDKQILIVSPTNLLAVLKIVADLWKIEQQNKNAIEIADIAGEIYDKLVLYVDTMEKVGTSIQSASEHYETAMKQLATGKGNAIKKLDDMKAKGINAKKQFSDKLIHKANQDE